MLAPGAWLRRAVEEGVVDPRRVVQVGLHGTGYAPDEFEWDRALGFLVIDAERCWTEPMADVNRDLQGVGRRADLRLVRHRRLDPSLAPGTGTPEIGGPGGAQALQLIRGCRGMAIVGADLVEVAPPYYPSGKTALVGANILYEILCVLPGVRYAPTGHLEHGPG